MELYKGLHVCLVIPAYNEERLIGPTLSVVPPVVDAILVVDDGSTDSTPGIVESCLLRDSRIELVRHARNRGPGGAIITGYKESSKRGYDVAVVVGGDNQMGFEYLTDFLEPLVRDEADYVKGNRFMNGVPKAMPFARLVGNVVLSAMTKVASGYWHVFDTQDGYTAISKKAIDTVGWEDAWEGYGYVSDFLIRFNYYGLRVKDVYRKEVYLPNVRQSQIKVLRYVRIVAPMIVRGFFGRLRHKYFHKCLDHEVAGSR